MDKITKKYVLEASFWIILLCTFLTVFIAKILSWGFKC